MKKGEKKYGFSYALRGVFSHLSRDLCSDANTK